MMQASTGSIPRRDMAILAAAVLFVSALYLLFSHFKYAIGFPLDDSWIHLTYARNLAQHGEWAFRPGFPSAGATSPLWVVLLAIGFLLNLAPYVWTYFLGMLTLFTLAVLCEWGARNLTPSYAPKIPWVGLFFALEWHFAWAALSGMETLLHGLIVTFVLILVVIRSPRYLTLGLLTGLSAWVRPDGLTLLGPVILFIVLCEADVRAKSIALLRYFIGFGSLFVPYLFFNLAVGGTPMPNTFYAKQAEYAAWQAQPFLERLGEMALQLSAGPGLILIPALAGWLLLALHKKDWGRLAVFLWAAGYLYLYISRLPVYQHGRYIMPAMPVIFFMGLLTWLHIDALPYRSRYAWIGRTLWRSFLGVLAVVFVFVGAQGYSDDVAIIESEMVATAKWVARNLPPDALIAAHDIGALGYFDDHPIKDLAGLISPEVIPFIRDEPKLAVYLNETGADYLIAFPRFYPTLTANLGVVFTTGSPFTVAFGEQNMAVYRWKRP